MVFEWQGPNVFQFYARPTFQKMRFNAFRQKQIMYHMWCCRVLGWAIRKRRGRRHRNDQEAQQRRERRNNERNVILGYGEAGCGRNGFYHATKHNPSSPHKRFFLEFRKKIGRQCFSVDEYFTS